MKFIDYTTIKVKAGDGGHGCIAFLREKFRPKGGPCGGDGGNGGNVIIQADQNLTTLQDCSYKNLYKAKRGEHGKGNNMHGKNGNDIIIKVPVGTIIKDDIKNQIISDLINHKQECLVAKGGNGGFGNARFKTKKQTAPRIANDGQIGQELSIILELKVLADVGLVGFPNAGKSTFISKVSNAKPKIADYPFTTMTPNLGIVKYGDYKSFVIADIPGIVKDAYKGKGLGLQFLKHIERTRILIIMLDGTSDNIRNDYKVLLAELEKYSSELLKNERLILITKQDIINEEDIKKIRFLNQEKYFLISSISNYNIQLAINEISKKVEKIR